MAGDTKSTVLFAWILLGFLRCSVCQTTTYTYVNETSLRVALQTEYDRYTKPASPTHIIYRYHIKMLDSLDITSQSMTHLGWFDVEWTDVRLTWTPADYGNITAIDVNWAWRPEMSVPNGANMEFGYDNTRTRMLLFHTGEIRWTPVMTGTTSCVVSPVKFPFDEQSCVVMVGFFGFTYRKDILINITDTEVGLTQYDPHGEWRLGSTEVVLEEFDHCCPKNRLARVNMWFNYSRMRPFHLMNLILPTVLFSGCLIWTFFLPTECGERLGYSLTILLAYTVLLGITTEMLPTTSTEIPYISSYLLTILILCTLAVCNVVMNVKLYFMEGEPHPAFKSLFLALKPIVFCSCRKSKKNKVIHVGDNKVAQIGNSNVFLNDLDTQAEKKLPADLEPSVDGQGDCEVMEVTWKDISVLLDRLCFFIYLMVIIICNVLLFVQLHA